MRNSTIGDSCHASHVSDLNHDGWSLGQWCKGCKGLGDFVLAVSGLIDCRDPYSALRWLALINLANAGLTSSVDAGTAHWKPRKPQGPLGRRL